jgi:hypothetical protein
MTDPGTPGHPVGPEIDDTQNPTEASPAEGSRAQSNLQSMLVQLQAMIDAVAVQAGPVLRDVAAKAAELAAVAGERAGPLAYKAAEKTQAVGQKVAERSKSVAADLRRQQATEAEPGSEAPADAVAATPEGDYVDKQAEMAAVEAGASGEWPAADSKPE